MGYCPLSSALFDLVTSIGFYHAQNRLFQESPGHHCVDQLQRGSGSLRDCRADFGFEVILYLWSVIAAAVANTASLAEQTQLPQGGMAGAPNSRSYGFQRRQRSAGNVGASRRNATSIGGAWEGRFGRTNPIAPPGESVSASLYIPHEESIRFNAP